MPAIWPTSLRFLTVGRWTLAVVEGTAPAGPYHRLGYTGLVHRYDPRTATVVVKFPAYRRSSQDGYRRTCLRVFRLRYTLASNPASSHRETVPAKELISYLEPGDIRGFVKLAYGELEIRKELV